MMAWSLPPTAGFAPRRADWRFLLEHPAHPIALGLGSGLAPRGPGTAGTLFGWAVYVLLHPWLNDWQWALVLLVSFGVGWWACTRCAQALRQSDPGAIVWDEVLGIWVVLWLVMPTDWLGQLAAVVIFRVFDIAKPGPVAWADGLFKASAGQSIGARQGLGILLDDLAAALCALLVIALWRLS
jgi:phosphatidylglycerophosphatase A